jgi:hypothetical protein
MTAPDAFALGGRQDDAPEEIEPGIRRWLAETGRTEEWWREEMAKWRANERFMRGIEEMARLLRTIPGYDFTKSGAYRMLYPDDKGQAT